MALVPLAPPTRSGGESWALWLEDREAGPRNTGPFYPALPLLLLPLLLLSPTPPPLNSQLQTLKKEMEEQAQAGGQGAEPGAGGTVEGGNGDRGIQPGFAFGVGKQAHK